MRLALTIACLVVVSSASTAIAQHEGHAAAPSVGYAPRAVLEKPVALRSGIGEVAERVTAASSDALAFYRQGMSYLHSYVWVEAARSFHQTLRLDPRLAMAHVGLSRAYSGLDDPAAARAALNEARKLAPSVSPRERRVIEIRGLQLDAIDDLTNVQKHLAVKRAIDDALAADITDLELWLLRGNLEEATAAGRGQRGGAASIAFYERALLIEPDNFAAHHYLTHSYEMVGDIPMALRHGQAYARLSRQVPHARHMYGHDLRRVGRIEEAIAEFTEADKLERAYYDAEALPSEVDWHHQHNLDLLSTSYQYLGQMKTAERLMREAFAINSVDDSREYQKRDWIGYLIGRARLDEALAAARSLQASQKTGGRLTGYLGAAQALLAQRRLNEARQALAAAERAQQALPAVPQGSALGRSAVGPELALVRAEIMLRTGARAEGMQLSREVVGQLRGLAGPDAWSQALFRMERLAQLARSLGEWELAAFVSEQLLAHDPAYAGTHYELARVAEYRGDLPRAQEAFAMAAALWAKADPDLPELIESRRKSGRGGL
jgi:tetratricopeptide (TPR) repeat protein